MRRRARGGIVAGVALCTALAGCAPTAVPGDTGASSTGSVPASPTPTAAPARELSVVLGGDLLWHNTTWFSAQEDARAAGLSGADDYDFGPMFGSLAPVIREADLAVCNEEVPLAAEGGPYHSYPSFAAPPEVAAGAAAAGYDLCTIASNHSLDQGAAGIERTVAAFRESGVLTTGAYTSEQEAGTPTVHTTEQGVRVAVVAGAYGFNGYQPPADRPWAVDRIDTTAMVERAGQARAAGADIVLAALHDGTEYQTAPTDQQVANARALAESGAFDLVYGHHAHTVQPWTKVGDTWVVYGLGNQIAQQKADQTITYEGITARFTFHEETPGDFEVTEATAIPTYVTRYTAGRPIRLVHVSAALDGSAEVPPGVDRATIERARDRTMSAVRSLGVEGVTVG